MSNASRLTIYLLFAVVAGGLLALDFTAIAKTSHEDVRDDARLKEERSVDLANCRDTHCRNMAIEDYDNKMRNNNGAILPLALVAFLGSIAYLLIMGFWGWSIHNDW